MTGIAESMESIGRYFAEQRLPYREPLHPMHEVEESLKKWMIEEGIPGRPIGNLKPVLEIMRIDGLNDLAKLRIYLSGVCLDRRPRECLAPLPLTVATYLIDGMLGQSWDQKGIEEARQNDPVDKTQRYKIKVVRDTFLWLRDLIGSAGTWSRKLLPQIDMNSERAIRENLSWLQDEETRRFCRETYSRRTLSEENETKIESLWQILLENQSLSIKYAFRLAQLGAKGSWDPETENFQRARGTEVWFEYNQVIFSLLMCGNR